MQHVVTDRVFILGLDELYRQAAKQCEATELLACARAVATALRVAPAANIPIEGYYTESRALTEYFQTMRTLQAVPRERAAEVRVLPEYKRLLEVASSPHVGPAADDKRLLPVARDPLSAALVATDPTWSVERLVHVAAEVADRNDDVSLVGLAARTRDAVLLTAVRESVVLYAEVVLGTGLPEPRKEEYIWQVDPKLEELGKRFVSAVNAVLHAQLPAPEAACAERYWHASKRNHVAGRCVRLGYAEQGGKTLHYHWAIKHTRDALRVHEFWDAQAWTTAMYRQVGAYEH